jgi:Flp pilus assembly pilin Flp
VKFSAAQEQDALMNNTQTLRSLRGFLCDEAGATAIGYSLIASGIVGAIIAVVTAMGTSLNARH